MCMMFCLYVCVCVHHMHAVTVELKRAPDALELELELQMVVCCLWLLGINLWSSGSVSSAANC